jgi:hypothetical protein
MTGVLLFNQVTPEFADDAGNRVIMSASGKSAEDALLDLDQLDSGSKSRE